MSDELVSKFSDLENVALKVVNCADVDYITLSGYAFFPIFPFQEVLSSDDIYLIDVSIENDEVKLCLLSQINFQEKEVTSLPEECYLAYAYLSRMHARGRFDYLPYDVVVVKEELIEKYLKFKSTSFFWGGFIHFDERNAVHDFKVNANRKISIDFNPIIESERHKKCLMNAAMSHSSKERFLHLFQFLELDYDYEIVKKLKSVDENNPIGLWGILGQQRNDIERLNYILLGFDNFSFLNEHLFEMREYQDSAVRIFYEFGKDSNPIKLKNDFEKLFFTSAAINFTELNQVKKSNSLKNDFWKDEGLYKKKIIELCCYWIYRVRCSIAHNKLGDYYIVDEDLPFLVKFCEPLLKEFIKFRIKNR